MIAFRDFFAAVRGGGPHAPYPWQEALAMRLADGDPPRAIVVPTGGGKTVTIEALIWALAMQADRLPSERTVGVRIVWAIDRRILVDEVHARAQHIARRLSDAARDSDDVLNGMALRLQTLTGDGAAPLRVTSWRGGLSRESRAHHPFQPEVITSTVAQIGSSLLFRGYGVGERSLALEAGLAAVDATICLDEAHLAEPFRQTVEAIRALRSRESIGLPGLRVITLTATPVPGALATNGQGAGGDVHSIDDDDRAALGERLTGEKVGRIVEPASDRAADQIAALVAAVSECLNAGSSTVACVVNSVYTAIEVEAAIAGDRPEVKRALLIGPQRGVDRADILERHRAQLFNRASAATPLVCVATQTFEVGLDADVEALVTQSASAAAIVQRLGRLNRAGEGRGRAVIVRDTQSPLYEDDEELAWNWLRSRLGDNGTIDLSVEALMRDQGRPAPARLRSAPGLTAAVVDLLVQTAPRPSRMADPDIEAFLRGAEEKPSVDVGLCWRCDLRLGDDSASGREYRQALLRLVKPEPGEIVTVSIARAHALLRALRAPREQAGKFNVAGLDTPDVEGGDVGVPSADIDSTEACSGGLSRLVVLRGRDQFEVSLDGSGDPQHDVPLRDVRPGDVLVLPSGAGGYANGALAPASRGVVPDVGGDLRLTTTTAIRLTEEVLSRMGLDPTAIQRRAERCDRTSGREGLEELRDLLGPYGAKLRGPLDLRRISDLPDDPLGDLDVDDDVEGSWTDTDDEDADGGRYAGVVLEGEISAAGPAFVLLARSNLTPEEVGPIGTDPPTLDVHAAAVAGRASDFLTRSGLPPAVAGAVILAGRAHDHGKADPRFQMFFRGGVPTFAAEPIAKSTFGTRDFRVSRRARRAAGLPQGLRHEIASVAALDDAFARGDVDDMPSEIDRELALHLVGTHHGLGRPVPYVPASEGTDPREFAARVAGIAGTARGDGLDGWADGAWLRRFVDVVGRYGPWGTAYLEAILMLADRTVSQEGGA